MREPIKDRGRIEHMLEMAQNLSVAKTQHSFSDIQNDRILFYGLTIYNKPRCSVGCDSK